MKNKLLIAILVFTFIFFGVSATKVLAKNGPSDIYSCITFYNYESVDYDDTKFIYEPNKVHNDVLEGVTYDKDSNTLTLNNLKTSLTLSITEMGEDFKINLVGENEIANLIVNAYEKDGSVEIIGDGSIIINQSKKFETGITLNADENSKIIVDSSATVKVYGSKNVIKVNYSKEVDGSKVIVLKNGQNIKNNILSKQQTFQQFQYINAFSLKKIDGIEYKVATKDGKKYTVRDDCSYELSKLSIANYEDNYFYDKSSNTTGQRFEIYNTLEDLENAGYVLTNDTVVINSEMNNFGTWPLVASEDGTRYAYIYSYDSNKALNLTENTMTLDDGNNYTIVTTNDDVQASSLDFVYNEVIIDGVYSHLVNLEKLEILKASAIINKEVNAFDEKSENDIAAKEAVNTLLKDSNNGEKVLGMSNELINTINEALANGDNVTVELDINNIEIKDLSNDIKDKVEAKIKEENDLNESNILGYFDISLVVKINGDTLNEKVTDLKDDMEVKLDVSELVKNLQAVANGKIRQYNIITIHNGEVKALKGSLNNDNILSFKTNSFSPYIVTYNDIDSNINVDIINPKTLDNINKYILILSISIVGLVIAIIYLKKRHN